MSTPTVLLDGEPVSFDGPLPDSAQQLFNLVAQALEPLGRCLTAFSVDGTDYTNSSWPKGAIPYAKVIASSQQQEALMLDLIDQVLPQLQAAEAGAETLGLSALCEDWDHTHAAARAWGGQLAPVVELLELLVNSTRSWGLSVQSTLTAQLDEASHALDLYTRSMETMNIGVLAEQALFTWRPWCAKLRESFTGPLQSALKERLT